MQSVVPMSVVGTRFSLYEFAKTRSRAAARTELGEILQQILELEVLRDLGRLAGEELVRLVCPTCGAAEAESFVRNGSYRRSLGTEFGEVVLRVPKIRCRCGSYVPRTTLVFHRRKRIWYDICEAAIELKGMRASYRAIAEYVARRSGFSLGLGTLVSALGAVRAPRTRVSSCPKELEVDGAFIRVRRGRMEKEAVLLAVDPRKDAPVKVLAAIHCPGEAQRDYEALSCALYEAGVTVEGGLTRFIADGATGAAKGLSFAHPGAEVGQCLWHIYRNVREKAVDKSRVGALLSEVSTVFERCKIEGAKEEIAAFAARWQQLEPEVVASVRHAARGGLNYLTSQLPFARRTTSHVERANRELRRLTRPMEAFRSSRLVGNYLAIWQARINARYQRQDWMRTLMQAMLD